MKLKNKADDWKGRRICKPLDFATYRFYKSHKSRELDETRLKMLKLKEVFQILCYFLFVVSRQLRIY